MMIAGECLCGAVRFRFPAVPDHVTSCNCSACRRYAPLWAYGIRGEVVLTEDVPTTAYLRGEKSLAFHSCAVCGVTTHWASQVDDRIAVNMRLADPAAIAGIPVWEFDGAASWTYLRKG